VKDKNVANEIAYALQVMFHVSCYCFAIVPSSYVALRWLFMAML
jgi:hypothetical protein